jgi:hypothetical protein
MLRIHQIIGIYLGGYTLQRRYGLQIRFKRNVDRVLLGAGLQYIPIHDDTLLYTFSSPTRLSTVTYISGKGVD